MKFLVVLVLFWLPYMAQAANDSNGQNGAGIFFGEPTGFTFKHWLTPETAFDAGIAFSFSDFVILYGDFLWHFPKLIQVRREDSKFLHQLTPYVGVGGVLFISDDDDRTHPKYYTQDGSTVALGVRVPIGIEWYPEPSPIRVYLEIVPGVGIIPSTFGFLQGGIGARYYF